MKTWMLLSENWLNYDPRDLGALVEAVRIAEAAGVDGVAVSEHFLLGNASAGGPPKFNPRDFDAAGNQDPMTPWPSSMVLLAACAAATTRIHLVAGAVIAPLRHPLEIAKELATLDLLSRGRLIVLPGVGWQEQEYEALGLDFHKRGAMLDEHLVAWRKVWAASPASHDGVHYRFNEVYSEPKPWRPEGPPLWITGATLHKPALRRIVQHGSGFAPGGPMQPGDRDKIDAALREAGRDVDSFDLLGVLPGIFTTATGPASLDTSLDMLLPVHRANRVTTLMFKPSQFIERQDELDGLCRRVVAAVKDQ